MRTRMRPHRPPFRRDVDGSSSVSVSMSVSMSMSMSVSVAGHTDFHVMLLASFVPRSQALE